jgi:hypothetical protein
VANLLAAVGAAYAETAPAIPFKNLARWRSLALTAVLWLRRRVRRGSVALCSSRSPTVTATLLTAGLACVIAAIIGGGLKAFSIEFPALGSTLRQLALAGFGILLVASALLIEHGALVYSSARGILDVSPAPESPRDVAGGTRESNGESRVRPNAFAALGPQTTPEHVGAAFADYRRCASSTNAADVSSRNAIEEDLRGIMAKLLHSSGREAGLAQSLSLEQLERIARREGWARDGARMGLVGTNYLCR